jgi:hypothetical protein
MPDIDAWIPYGGLFDDHIQYLYFRQLYRFAERMPEKVLPECELLLKESLVERERDYLVLAADLARKKLRDDRRDKMDE